MLIAYTPFLTPLNLHEVWWFTLIPMAFFVAVAYKSVRLADISGAQFWKKVLVMTAQIVLAMIALATGLYILIEIIVPWFQS